MHQFLKLYVRLEFFFKEKVRSKWIKGGRKWKHGCGRWTPQPSLSLRQVWIYLVENKWNKWQMKHTNRGGGRWNSWTRWQGMNQWGVGQNKQTVGKWTAQTKLQAWTDRYTDRPAPFLNISHGKMAQRKRLKFCQAQPQPQLQLSWAELR